jgi:hypothetical protein
LFVVEFVTLIFYKHETAKTSIFHTNQLEINSLELLDHVTDYSKPADLLFVIRPGRHGKQQMDAKHVAQQLVADRLSPEWPPGGTK